MEEKYSLAQACDIMRQTIYDFIEGRQTPTIVIAEAVRDGIGGMLPPYYPPLTLADFQEQFTASLAHYDKIYAENPNIREIAGRKATMLEAYRALTRLPEYTMASDERISIGVLLVCTLLRHEIEAKKIHVGGTCDRVLHADRHGQENKIGPQR